MIRAPSSEGKEVILNIINEGEIFGEIPLLDGKERTADATAMTDCKLLIVARRSFLPLLERPVIAHELLNVLCERLRRTTEQLEDVLFLDLEVRIAKILLRFAEAGGPAQPGARVAVCFGRVGSRWSDPATRSALREQMPIAVSELADQYLMRSVTWASSALTAKAASLNR